jgi:hypothetical protein
MTSASAPTPVTKAELWVICHGRPTKMRPGTGDASFDWMNRPVAATASSMCIHLRSSRYPVADVILARTVTGA